MADKYKVLRLRKQDGNIVNIANKLGEMMGQDGGYWITDTIAHTPTAGKVYVAIEAVADTTMSNTDVTGNITGLPGKLLKDGRRVLGRWTSLKIDGGAIIAYEGT